MQGVSVSPDRRMRLLLTYLPSFTTSPFAQSEGRRRVQRRTSVSDDLSGPRSLCDRGVSTFSIIGSNDRHRERIVGEH
jgi:hypothetical protein